MPGAAAANRYNPAWLSGSATRGIYDNDTSTLPVSQPGVARLTGGRESRMERASAVICP